MTVLNQGRIDKINDLCVKKNIQLTLAIGLSGFLIAGILPMGTIISDCDPKND